MPADTLLVSQKIVFHTDIVLVLFVPFNSLCFFRLWFSWRKGGLNHHKLVKKYTCGTSFRYMSIPLPVSDTLIGDLLVCQLGIFLLNCYVALISTLLIDLTFHRRNKSRGYYVLIRRSNVRDQMKGNVSSEPVPVVASSELCLGSSSYHVIVHAHQA